MQFQSIVTHCQYLSSQLPTLSCSALKCVAIHPFININFIMCSLKSRISYKSFDSKDKSQSNLCISSPFFQSLTRPFSSCFIWTSCNSITISTAMGLLNQIYKFITISFSSVVSTSHNFITISTARTILNQICLHLLPFPNLYPDHFDHVFFHHLIILL